MKTRNLAVIGSIMLACLAINGYAADYKIGYVNILKILDSSPQVKAANERMAKEFAPRQRQLEEAQKEITDLRARLAKDGSIMSADEAKGLQRDIIAKQRELKRSEEELQQDANFRRSEELDKLQRKIKEVIEALYKEEKYDLILSDGVIIASDKVDITSKVLDRLGK